VAQETLGNEGTPSDGRTYQRHFSRTEWERVFLLLRYRSKKYKSQVLVDHLLWKKTCLRMKSEGDGERGRFPRKESEGLAADMPEVSHCLLDPVVTKVDPIICN
jgi:hypothetical protein